MAVRRYPRLNFSGSMFVRNSNKSPEKGNYIWSEIQEVGSLTYADFFLSFVSGLVLSAGFESLLSVVVFFLVVLAFSFFSPSL